MSNKCIYKPEGKAGEYSEWACNLYNGCSNGCTYCYLKRGPMSGTLGISTPTLKKTLGGTPETAYKVFCKELSQHKDEIVGDGSGYLFFTFTSDPCLPETIDLNMLCMKTAIDEGVKVMMTHIGGYPGRYASGIKSRLDLVKPKIFVCGHSHILKVIPDRSLGVLTINPGAAGRQGWQNVRTLLRLTLDAGNITGCQIIELADDRNAPKGRVVE